MILTGNEILRQVEQGKIVITPFNKENITTNSYDISIGNEIAFYEDKILDPKKDNPISKVPILDEGFVLTPDKIYLVGTYEKIGSDFFVPICKGRSSTARLGIFVHITADIIDLGSHAHWTLQLRAVESVKIYPFMKLAQATFWKPIGNIDLYNGKYQGSEGLVGSKFFLDFQ